MASLTALTVPYAFSVLLLLCCPQLLVAATTALQALQWGLESVAATALFPAVVVTLVLTPLLSFAHVWAIGRGGAAGDRHLVTGLAKATFLAATVALLASAVLQIGSDGALVQLGADGHLDRGRGDVARLNIMGVGLGYMFA